MKDNLPAVDLLKRAKVEVNHLEVFVKQLAVDTHREVKASETSTSVHPWVAIALDYKREHPTANRRARAAAVFARLDGQQQAELTQEFSKCRDYRGKTYRTAKEAAIAKVMRTLEQKEKGHIND